MGIAARLEAAHVRLTFSLNFDSNVGLSVFAAASCSVAQDLKKR